MGVGALTHLSAIGEQQQPQQQPQQQRGSVNIFMSESESTFGLGKAGQGHAD